MTAKQLVGVRLVAGLAALLMAGMLVYAAVAEGRTTLVLAQPWGQAMLADVGLALAALAAWIAWREGRPGPAAAWAIAIAAVGSLAVAVYVLWASLRLAPGDPAAALLLGRHRSSGRYA